MLMIQRSSASGGVRLSVSEPGASKGEATARCERGSLSSTRAGSRHDANCLSRRPAEWPSAEQMQMEMKNGLAGSMAGIQHNPVSIAGIVLIRELGCHAVQVAQDRFVRLRRPLRRSKMLSGN